MNIKKGEEENYQKYIVINKDDEYSKACVDAGELMGKALDEGKTGKEALGAIKGLGLTGFMATMAVKGVAHFHERGQELLDEWNKQWGAPSEIKGIVNPAVVDIDEEGKMTPTIEEI